MTSLDSNLLLYAYGENCVFHAKALNFIIALILREQRVREFATANVKDFQGFGFTKVWNPLTE